MKGPLDAIDALRFRRVPRLAYDRLPIRLSPKFATVHTEAYP